MSDLALHFLAKMKIMVVKDIDREDIEFVCKVSDMGVANQLYICVVASLLNSKLSIDTQFYIAILY